MVRYAFELLGSGYRAMLSGWTGTRDYARGFIRSTMGSAWAGDPTPRMIKSIDGHHFVFIFLELRSGLLHPIPMKEKTALTCIEAFETLEGFVRRRFPNATLRQLHFDSDPVITKTNPLSSLTGPRNVQELDEWLSSSHPDLTIKHSPPHTQAMNPAENMCGQAYYKMNYYLLNAFLSTRWWEDMLSAAIAVLNCIVRINSRDKTRKRKSPIEITTGKRPDLSDFQAPPRQPREHPR